MYVFYFRCTFIYHGWKSKLCNFGIEYVKGHYHFGLLCFVARFCNLRLPSDDYYFNNFVFLFIHLLAFCYYSVHCLTSFFTQFVVCSHHPVTTTLTNIEFAVNEVVHYFWLC